MGAAITQGGIGSWVTRRAVRTPESVTLVDAGTGEEVTYAALADRVTARAGALRAHGVKKGDRVMVVSSNSPAMIELLFATARLGAICVPVNFRLNPAEVAYLVEDAAPVLVAHDATWHQLAVDALAGSSAPQTPLVAIDTLHDAGADAGEQLVSPDDVAVIMYTSGTTGRPKGAMLTHANFEANAINMITAGRGLSREDSTLTVAPLFHIGALGLYTLPLLYVGGRVVIAPAFVPQQTLELMAAHRVTVQFLVPAMWDALLKVPTFDDHDLSSLRMLLCGGAPCPLPVIDGYLGKGFTFMEGFGMTETAPTALVLETEFVRTKAGSVGRPFLLTDVRIVDEMDRDVALGEVGELVLSGPNVFGGYWGLPEVSAEAKRGDWFHSGDLARQDADGFVTLVDRKKDMIISGGENVYPIEVEQALYQHPAVAEVAVIGVPDPQWGETVVAVVVAAPDAGPDATDADALIAHCRDRIAHFKSPRRVEFVDELPRNATGKLLKRELRVRFTGAAEAVSR